MTKLRESVLVLGISDAVPFRIVVMKGWRSCAQQQLLASRINMVRQGPGVLSGKVQREESARTMYGDMAWAAANSAASAKAASRRGLLVVD